MAMSMHAATHSTSTYKRSEDVWYEDGNIVLEAGGTLFRVYRGILSQNSAVFADLFNLATPAPADDDTFDGCPLVHLHDNPAELGAFLRALHDCSFYEAYCTSLQPEKALGILRMSGKYLVEPLRARCTRSLSHLHLDSLSELLPTDDGDETPKAPV